MTGNKTRFIVLIVLLSIGGLNSRAGDTLSNTCRQKLLFGSAAVGYVVGFGGLYTVWYQDYSQNSFHLFNDNGEWQQIDKAGHAFTAYQAARLSSSALQWSGISTKKAIWLGSLNALLFQSSIEVMDGLSEGWGFSPGDMLSNTLGCALYTSQALIWKEQKFSLKFSYHFSEYARYRPDVLGESYAVRLIKDYNGHTYWLSGNLKSITHSSTLPPWLNLALGYSGKGMLSANTSSVILEDGTLVSFPRYRQVFLSPDIDFTRIPVKSKWLKTFFSVLNCVKLPFPALEYNTKDGFILRSFVF